MREVGLRSGPRIYIIVTGDLYKCYADLPTFDIRQTDTVSPCGNKGTYHMGGLSENQPYRQPII